MYIPAIGSGEAGAGRNLTANPAIQRPASGLITSLNPSLTQNAAPTQSGQPSQIAQQVAEMMQHIGGGVQNDQNLQMLIGLMILMTLLQGQNGGQSAEQAGQAMNDLAKMGLGGQMAGLRFTSVEIQQSTTIVVASQNISMDGVNAFGGTGDLTGTNGISPTSPGQGFDNYA